MIFNVEMPKAERFISIEKIVLRMHIIVNYTHRHQHTHTHPFLDLSTCVCVCVAVCVCVCVCVCASLKMPSVLRINYKECVKFTLGLLQHENFVYRLQ